MTYELAKQLKDAGFKQGGAGHLINQSNKPLKLSARVFGVSYRKPYVPTISELIYACGEDFAAIFRILDSQVPWQAVSTVIRLDTKEPIDSIGLTIEEAVANLWLALNKKQ